MGIAEIKDLIFDFKYDKALMDIEMLDQKDEIEGQILKAFVLHRRGAYKVAISNIDVVLKQPSLAPEHRFAALVVKSYSLALSGIRSKAHIILDEAESVLIDLDELTRGELMDWEGIMFHAKAMAVNRITIDDMMTSIRYYETSGELLVKAGREIAVYPSLQNISWLYFELGEVNEFESIIHQMEEIIQGSEYLAVRFYSAIYSRYGLLYHMKGEMDKAEEYILKSINYLSSNLSGDPYTQYSLAYDQFFLSQLYYDLTEFEKSLDSGIKSLLIFENLDDARDTSGTLFQLILTAVKLNKISLANKYLIKLEKLTQAADPYFVNLVNSFYGLAKAILLLKNTRTTARADAQRLLENLITSQIYHYRIVILAHVNLCELLLEELKQTSNLEVMNEVESILKKVHSLAQKNNSYSLIGESLLLKAQLEFFHLRLPKAKEMIREVITIAFEKGLARLETKAIEIQSNIEREIKTSVEVARQSPELLERLEKTQLIEYIVEMKKMVEVMKTS